MSHPRCCPVMLSLATIQPERAARSETRRIEKTGNLRRPTDDERGRGRNAESACASRSGGTGSNPGGDTDDGHLEQQSHTTRRGVGRCVRASTTIHSNRRSPRTLNWVIDGYQSALHGHMHDSVDERLGGTRLAASPPGDVDESKRGFDPALMIGLLVTEA